MKKLKWYDRVGEALDDLARWVYAHPFTTVVIALVIVFVGKAFLY